MSQESELAASCRKEINQRKGERERASALSPPLAGPFASGARVARCSRGSGASPRETEREREFVHLNLWQLVFSCAFACARGGGLETSEQE